MGPYIGIIILALFSLYQYLVIVSLVKAINSMRPWAAAVTAFIGVADRSISQLESKVK